jgi:hypothetical protein
VQQEPLASSRFAVVFFGASGENGVVVAQDFSDANTACATLQNLAMAQTEEYQLQGVLTAGRMDWPAGYDRHVVVFTDEDLHFFGTNDGTDVVGECEGSYDLGVFSTPSTAWEWDPYVNACGGFVGVLSQDPATISAKLESEYGRGC